MLDPATLESRFDAELPAAPAEAWPFAPPARPAARKPAFSQFQLAIAVIVAVAALAVVMAAMRMTDEAVYRAVEARQAPERFLADELSALRLMAMSDRSVVPARLYLGIEECFKSRAAVPFDEENLAPARQTLAICADMEIGRLYAQGGLAMAEEGRRVLQQAGVLAPLGTRAIE